MQIEITKREKLLIIMTMKKRVDQIKGELQRNHRIDDERLREMRGEMFEREKDELESMIAKMEEA